MGTEFLETYHAQLNREHPLISGVITALQQIAPQTIDAQLLIEPQLDLTAGFRSVAISSHVSGAWVGIKIATTEQVAGDVTLSCALPSQGLLKTFCYQANGTEIDASRKKAVVMHVGENVLRKREQLIAVVANTLGHLQKVLE